MEMADAIFINKADGDNINSANRAKSEYKNALHLFPPTQSGWIPKVGTCSANTKKGIPEVWETIKSYENFTKTNGFFEQKRKEQKNLIMFESINERLKNDFYENNIVKQNMDGIITDLQSDKISSYVAAQKLLDLYYESRQQKSG
jgi:LAO/AO transport system kinase